MGNTAPKSRLEYVEFYAEKLKNDNTLFKQQKMLIESQMHASQSFFSNLFKGDFKKEARKYLRGVGLL